MAWQTALTTVFAVGFLTVVTAASWFGVALAARGGYRWARNSRSSRAYAVAGGMIGGIMGIAGGWVVADFRAARTHLERPVRWCIGAAATWTAAAFLSGVVATDIATQPQAGQSVWVALFVLLPVLPLIASLAVGCTLTIRRGVPSWVSLRVSQTLLWSSLAVVILAVPKPN
jgi:hypothetical protein